MRFGIITDIHANLEALNAVLDFCTQQKVDEIICLGDIVGCGASPQECLDVLRQKEILTLAGNHDWAVCGKRSLDYFDKEGEDIILWTRKQLNDDDIRYLQALPLIFIHEYFTIVHSTLNEPEKFIDIESDEDAQSTFQLMDSTICFTGHTHEPSILVQEGGVISHAGDVIVTCPAHKYVVNAGSVGRPRDGDPRASVVIYDTETAVINIKRVNYDIEKAQRKIIEAGLPEGLSRRLSVGQ